MSGPSFPVVIFHNPECGASRTTLALIRAAGYEPEIIDYVKVGWTQVQLLTLFAAARLSPREALREKEAQTRDPTLLTADGPALIAAMSAAPILVQRPFVATPIGVRLCRPEATVLDVLERRPAPDALQSDGQVDRSASTRFSIALRAALMTDIPTITAIYAHAVLNGTASYELVAPSEDEMAKRFAAIIEAGYPYWVAQSNGAVIGYAYASAFRARPAYRFMAENSVYVAPNQQARGVGRALMERLTLDLERLGFRQIIAVIGDGRANAASVRLHRAMGFSEAGVIKGSGFKFERWLETVLMQKLLDGGPSRQPDADSWPERKFNSGR